MRLAGALGPGVFVCPLRSGRGRSLRTEQCACRERLRRRRRDASIGNQWTLVELFFEESSTSYYDFSLMVADSDLEEAPLIKE
jgi:hypothetical protein